MFYLVTGVLCFYLVIDGFRCFAQNIPDANDKVNTGKNKLKATIKGTVYNKDGDPIPYASIQIINKPGIGTRCTQSGEFTLFVPAEDSIVIEVKALNYQDYFLSTYLIEKEVLRYNFVLNYSEGYETQTITIKDNRFRNQISTISIQPKNVKVLPSPFGDFNSILATMPGVVANNELSSSYSVRGGSYDENLVYVNDIEIYRPQLVRAGQQEGLSFVNPDLVKNVEFSAGGWQPRYGDKLGSVLNVQYKNPEEWGGSATASLLFQSAHIEGVSKDKKLSFVTGIRRKTAQYLLGTLDVQGEYLPNFVDWQGAVNYELSAAKDSTGRGKTTISLIFNYSRNRYLLIPTTRETDYGSFQAKQRFTVAFAGQESMEYDTWQAGLQLSHTWSDRWKSDITFSQVLTRERENIDVEGGYRLCDVQNDPSRSNFNECIALRSIGTLYNYGRNSLDGRIYQFLNRNYYFINNKSSLEFGVSGSAEVLQDRLYEYSFTDSADFVNLGPLIESNYNITQHRLQGYLQHSYNPSDEHSFTYGVRLNYFSLNNQLLVSPRFQYAYHPSWNNRLHFRFATGLYAQPAFYREMRDFEGVINTRLKAQESCQCLTGLEYNFKFWSRDFKLVWEGWYKFLWNVNAYDVDNVRIRYFANNNARAWAWGTDVRIAGEFIRGAESWFGLSILSTKEDLAFDTRGYYRRPTDQRITFNAFFQDQLPGNPSVRAYLNLIAGTGLPFSPPNNINARSAFVATPYRRVDVGFSKVISVGGLGKGIGNRVDMLMIGAEILNVLGVSNTISYQWIKDLNNFQFAIPNTLSQRFFNIKVIANFK